MSVNVIKVVLAGLPPRMRGSDADQVHERRPTLVVRRPCPTGLPAPVEGGHDAPDGRGGGVDIAARQLVESQIEERVV
jgi:hypothetical protein